MQKQTRPEMPVGVITTASVLRSNARRQSVAQTLRLESAAGVQEGEREGRRTGMIADLRLVEAEVFRTGNGSFGRGRQILSRLAACLNL